MCALDSVLLSYVSFTVFRLAAPSALILSAALPTWCINAVKRPTVGGDGAISLNELEISERRLSAFAASFRTAALSSSGKGMPPA
ncbi:hypothetical protein MB84_19550 [Pandoraea oxalativorans]|uniref:Uncharacterized protein n=1 Tax=Pandoraea oxalativorans TaxID=573737 RepID=A0A0E3U7V8_9BURK|nr:hypothetical protein MB84_19550 [Pandoraea oxalativorans]